MLSRDSPANGEVAANSEVNIKMYLDVYLPYIY
jgi:hypothetical protein